MPAYTFSNQLAGTPQNLTTTQKTQLNVSALTGAATLRRGWLMEWEIGADGARQTTSIAIAWTIMKSTAAGTGTAITPNPNDTGGGDAAAQLTYAANHTVEPTYVQTANLWYLPLDQQASYRIQMRDKFSALIVPAVTTNGLAMGAKSATYASTVGWRCLLEE
jgi:hypothetical protein